MAAGSMRDCGGLSFSIERILSPDFGHRRWKVKSDPLFHWDPPDLPNRVSSWLEQLKKTTTPAKRRLSTGSESSESKVPSPEDPLHAPTTDSKPSSDPLCEENSSERPPSADFSSPPSKRRVSLDKDFFSPLQRCPSNDKEGGSKEDEKSPGDGAMGKDLLLNGSDKWPVWVYCNRYSPRPSSGPRSRRQSRKCAVDEKRCRTAFSGAQLQRLRDEFSSSPYLSESRRASLAAALQLSEAQVKIWFQNMRAKLKRSCREKDPLAMKLMEQGLYNHSTNKE